MNAAETEHPLFIQGWSETFGQRTMCTDFEFCGIAPIPDGQPIGNKSIAFREAHRCLADLKMSKHATAAMDKSCMAAYRHELEELNTPSGRQHWMVMDPVEGEPMMLVLSAFSATDLANIWLGDISKQLGIVLLPNILQVLSTADATRVRNLLQKIMDNDAGPDQKFYKCTTAQDIATSSMMEHLGLIHTWQSMVPGTGQTQEVCQLTSAGLSSVGQRCRLENVHQAIQPRPNIQLEDMDVLELLSWLEERQWECHMTNVTDHMMKKNLPPYEPPPGTDKKHFFLTVGELAKRHYLLALAMGKHVVQHGLSHGAYKDLCFGSGLGEAGRKRRRSNTDGKRRLSIRWRGASGASGHRYTQERFQKPKYNYHTEASRSKKCKQQKL